ncbi:MAG: glycosyltransferase [Chloroflexi bacterium]|nr:glycosyltransferase [Chloroflexota bacterium]|tara:strand:- start:3854 stop:4657 length:804 start_codon:yes stop_codon:yes gene_type:complete
MQDEPIVSVILVAFNEDVRLLKRSINSITQQTLKNIELIIVDDSTEQKTVDIINQISSMDHRIKVLRTEEKKIFSQALNLGLEKAKGKFIARMDPDDISHPIRLESQVDFLENNPRYSIVGSAIQIIDENGLEISSRKYPKSSSALKLWSIFRNPLAHPTVMMRRGIIDEGFLYDEDFSKAEDLELWLRLMNNNHKIYNLEQFLLSYRVVGNFSDKRFGENFQYNFLARRKNFSWRKPISGAISLVFAKMYTFVPKRLIDSAYKITK